MVSISVFLLCLREVVERQARNMAPIVYREQFHE